MGKKIGVYVDTSAFLSFIKGQNPERKYGVDAMVARYRAGYVWSTDFHLGLTGAPLVIHQH